MINNDMQITQGYQLIDRALSEEDRKVVEDDAKKLLKAVPMASVVYFLAQAALISIELQTMIVERSYNELKDEDNCSGLKVQVSRIVNNRARFNKDNEETRLEAYDLYMDVFDACREHRKAFDNKLVEAVRNYPVNLY